MSSAIITSQQSEWLGGYLRNLSGKLESLPAGTRLDPVLGIVLAGSPPDESYTRSIAAFSEIQSKNKLVSAAMDRIIGQLILHFVATRKTTVEEAISQLDLVNATSKSRRTLEKLPRIVSLLPDEVFQLPGLSTMHFEAVTSFGGPKSDPESIDGFSRDRVALLREISESPSKWTKSAIHDRMREIQAKYKVESNRAERIEAIRTKFIDSSAMLLEWHDDDFTAAGLTRQQVYDYWCDWKEQLVERGVIDEELHSGGAFRPAWGRSSSKVIDVEPVQQEPA